MCRIFGFRSVIKSQVHKSLLDADNAIAAQSREHTDGWGVGYYVCGAPHIIKSEKTAFEDQLFTKISGIVSSETVVAHIRKATVGETNVLNTHPFQYGNWVFAHNGNIKDFENYRDKISAKIATPLKRFILGKTDSELVFYLLLTHISKYIQLNRPDCSFETLKKGVRDGLDELFDIIGAHETSDSKEINRNYLTFLLTNGASIIAYQGGKPLLYSTHKHSCDEKDTCPDYSYECENPTESGYINHLIFTSEKLHGENLWVEMNPGELVGVDWRMKLETIKLI